MKVLLVDDTQLFLDLGKSFLDRESFEVTTATSGPEALDEINREKPDLVILDLYMPGMRGDEVCRKIKSDPDTHKILIIMMSSASVEGAEEMCLSAGCDAFVPKPIKRDELLDAIEKIAVIAKRKYPRIPTHIMCCLSAEGYKQDGYITSISEGGLFLEVKKTLEMGEQLNIQFSLSGLDQDIKATVAVCWTGTFRPDASPGVGFQFMEITGKDRGAIRDHVESRLKSLLTPLS
jgi:CheY-like chemotaxis protein/Tfp pilus assembly protein PilZ